MFEGLKINWSLFDRAVSELGPGEHATIIVVENQPNTAPSGISAQTLSDISYYDAMGRSIARESGDK